MIPGSTINRVKDSLTGIVRRIPDFKEVTSGAPYFDDIANITNCPAAFITSDQSMARFTPRGSAVPTNAGSTADGTDNLPVSSELRYGIIIVVDGKDGPTTEREADRITGLVWDEITKFHGLSSDPASLGDGRRIVDSAYVESTGAMQPGSDKLGRYITVRISLTG